MVNLIISCPTYLVKKPQQTHPILEIKTWVHIVKFDQSEPRNITKDSMDYLTKQFQWINQMFRKLQPPTVANVKRGETLYKRFKN